MKPIIKVENLSKQYRLGNVGTGTIKDDLKRWWHNVQGKEDPFLTIGDTNDRTAPLSLSKGKSKGLSKGSLKSPSASSGQQQSNYVWALKDINFDVQPGEVLGIIGRNGAGKSTLLKILSRVTEPTTGRVTMNGRVASLLEVGTGMHPDLTGRENIYLNGAILGMSRQEINRKLEEIIDFSGVERYIDTPVKRYSSGMHVRLGFAVAAHLEPEILIVDEVLAVGDAEFQKKCIGKMKDVSTNEGRTVLFVSHNMAAIQKLCNRGLLLKDGAIQEIGAIHECIEKYLLQQTSNPQRHFEPQHDLPAYAVHATFNKGIADKIKTGDVLNFDITVQVKEDISEFICGIGIIDSQDVSINTTWAKPLSVSNGRYQFSFFEDRWQLAPGFYKIVIGLSKGTKNFQYLDDVLQFEIEPITTNTTSDILLLNRNSGIILNQMQVNINDFKNKEIIGAFKNS